MISNTLTAGPEAMSDNARSESEQEIARRIDAKIEESIRFYATQPPEAIGRRMEELDNECDVDGYLAMTAAGVGLGGIALSFLGGGKKWLLVAGAFLALLLKQALHGTSPAMPLLRKFGVRTRAEIDREKNVLKILRGDFQLDQNKLEQLKNNPAQDVLRSVTT
jgi:hypothetical protein